MPGGGEVKFPRFTLALVQHEGQMLHTPGHDLTTFLEDRSEQWRTESFTERTFEGLLKSASQFSCVVIGFNVLRSPVIRAALARESREGSFPAGMLILHQGDAEAFACLHGELELDVDDLPLVRSKPLVAAEREGDKEILLNWPQDLLTPHRSGELLTSKASKYFRLGQGTAWRVVLEERSADQRLPVVVRTKASAPNRVVVCSLKLEPRDEHQAKLLENMITYCGVGTPDVAVVQDQETASGHRSIGWNAGVIARRLRLQGASTLEVYVPSASEVDFGRWPLTGVSQVILANRRLAEGTPLESDAGKRWLESGGTVLELGDSDRLTIRSGASEAHWVAQRWAAWFQSTEPTKWQSDVVDARAVLRVLTTLHQSSSRAQPEQLGLPQPGRYAEEVAKLLDGAVRDGNCDETISTTAAAYDLARLAGVAHRPPAREIPEWLKDSFPSASLEEKFDIARCLEDRDRFQQALEEAVRVAHVKELSAICHTRLRQAAVACNLGLENSPVRKAMGLQVASRSSLSQFDDRLRLSAEFIIAVINFASIHANDEEIVSEVADRATATISDRGRLTRMGRAAEATIDPEEISLEALALLAYSSLTNESTLFMRPELNDLPISAVEPVLAETQRARELEDQARKALALLGTVQLVFGAVALLAAIAGLAVLASLRTTPLAGVGGLAALTALLVATISAILSYALLARLQGRSRNVEDTERALSTARDLLGALSGIVAIAAFVAVAGVLKPSLFSPQAVLTVGSAGVVFMFLVYLLGRAELSPTWSTKIDEIVRRLPGLPQTMATFIRSPSRAPNRTTDDEQTPQAPPR